METHGAIREFRARIEILGQRETSTMVEVLTELKGISVFQVASSNVSQVMKHTQVEPAHSSAHSVLENGSSSIRQKVFSAQNWLYVLQISSG